MGSASQACDLLKSGKTWTIKSPARDVGTAGLEGSKLPNSPSLGGYTIWQYGLWSFQTGGTKLERFLPKNQHTESKLLNLSFQTSEF